MTAEPHLFDPHEYVWLYEHLPPLPDSGRRRLHADASRVRLRDAARTLAAARHLVDRLTDDAVGYGHSWAEIGADLGVSKQAAFAAHKRRHPDSSTR